MPTLRELRRAESGDTLRALFAELWDAVMVAKHYGCTAATVHNWRKRPVDPLPGLILPGDHRDNVRFLPSEVRAWAKRNSIIEVL